MSVLCCPDGPPGRPYGYTPAPAIYPDDPACCAYVCTTAGDSNGPANYGCTPAVDADAPDNCGCTPAVDADAPDNCVCTPAVDANGPTNPSGIQPTPVYPESWITSCHPGLEFRDLWLL